MLAIARSHDLKIVEDAAHAVGSARHLEGRGMTRVGTIGDLSCFSFYATKNITSAEGGMVTTEDEALGRAHRGREPARDGSRRLEALRQQRFVVL